MFQNSLVLNPLPTTPANAAAQTVHFMEKIAQDGFAATKLALRQDILAVTKGDRPSSTKRLHLLYAQVYTQDELDGLIDKTFDQLGLRE